MVRADERCGRGGGTKKLDPKSVWRRDWEDSAKILLLCVYALAAVQRTMRSRPSKDEKDLCVFMHINLYELVLCSANFFAPCVADIISFQNTTHKILGKIYWIISVNYLKLEILLNHWWFHSFWVSISRHLRRLRFASLAICTKLQAAWCTELTSSYTCTMLRLHIITGSS